MANKKSETKTSKKTVKKTATKKVENKEIISQPVQEVISNENEELKKQIEEMKASMMTMMQANQAMQAFIQNLQNTQAPAEKVYIKQEDAEVIIGCRVINGVGWGDRSDATGEIRLSYKEEQSVAVSDMKIFFRQSHIKRLFEDGLCYFANPEDYLIFKIKTYNDLSDEHLVEMLDKADHNEIIRDLNKLTDNKKNGNVVNCMIYRICDMIRNKTLDWGYYTRKAIEEYFNMDFDRGINTLNMLDRFKN